MVSEMLLKGPWLIEAPAYLQVPLLLDEWLQGTNQNSTRAWTLSLLKGLPFPDEAVTALSRVHGVDSLATHQKWLFKGSCPKLNISVPLLRSLRSLACFSRGIRCPASFSSPKSCASRSVGCWLTAQVARRTRLSTSMPASPGAHTVTSTIILTLRVRLWDPCDTGA